MGIDNQDATGGEVTLDLVGHTLNVVVVRNRSLTRTDEDTELIGTHEVCKETYSRRL